MDNMTRTVQLLKRPDGTRQFPSRSCCDLKEQYPSKESGEQMQSILNYQGLSPHSVIIH